MNDVPTIERPTCATCAYYDPADPSVTPGEDMGLCRRSSPRAVTSSYDDDAELSCFPTWPVVVETEWCGEHSGFETYLYQLSYARNRAAQTSTTS